MDEDIKVLLSPGTSGPPLGIRAADIIERGGRIRRRRKRLAVAGSSLATVAVIVLGAVAVGARGGEATAPVEPAGPGLSTVSLAPAPPVELSPTAHPESEIAPDGRPPTTPEPGASRPGLPETSQTRSPQQGRTTSPSPKRPPAVPAPPQSTPTAISAEGRVR